MTEGHQMFRYILIAITMVLQIGCISAPLNTKTNAPQHNDTAKISQKSVKPVVYPQISAGVKCGNKKDEIEVEMCLCGKKAGELYNIYGDVHSEIQRKGYQLSELKRSLLQDKYNEMKNCRMRKNFFGWVVTLLNFEWNI